MIHHWSVVCIRIHLYIHIRTYTVLWNFTRAPSLSFHGDICISIYLYKYTHFDTKERRGETPLLSLSLSLSLTLLRIPRGSLPVNITVAFQGKRET